jgi:hypothetical protein
MGTAGLLMWPKHRRPLLLQGRAMMWPFQLVAAPVLAARKPPHGCRLRPQLLLQESCPQLLGLRCLLQAAWALRQQTALLRPHAVP